MRFNRQGVARFEFSMVGGQIISVRQAVEISLDCHICQRRMRTIVFSRIETFGICTPTNHEFPGQLLNARLSDRGGIYEFVYNYFPFVDKKYPDERRYLGFEQGGPTWARFYCSVRCKQCGEISDHSTQTNLGRPRSCRCACGSELYQDLDVPTLSWSLVSA